jgi:hypothetical protein
MSYFNGRSRAGLMGLGAVADEQEPINLGARAKEDPILSAASLIASSILVRMAGVPQHRRLAEMVTILNAGRPGSGDAAAVDYRRRAAAAPDKKDQAMFDAVRAAIAAELTRRTLKSSVFGIAHLTGLGQTLAEARGQTSRGVNDAQAVFCTYIAGTSAMIGGYVDQLATAGTQNTGNITRASGAAAATGGCGAGQLVIQGENALAQARLAQSGQAAAALAAAAREATFMKFALVGGGLLGAMILGYVVVKKM